MDINFYYETDLHKCFISSLSFPAMSPSALLRAALS